MKTLFDQVESTRAIVVQSHWNKVWFVNSLRGMFIPGLRRGYPTPRIAAKAAIAKGFTIEAGDHNTAVICGIKEAA